jgi:hypothetical protein
MSSDKVAEIKGLVDQDPSSAWVTALWEKYNHQRDKRINEWTELRNYVFATDTSTTSNSSLPWKNSTTIPKLCQIRDNLYANYKSALFPNSNWLKWVANSQEAAAKSKRDVIETYMSNKVGNSRVKEAFERILLDYIDYGMAFATVGFESRYKELSTGDKLPNYVGPMPERISPMDIVFNPLAASFTQSHKIVRSIKTIGELKKLAETDPDQRFWTEAIEKRLEIKRNLGGYSKEDFDKAIGFEADGFGSMYEYFTGDYVEILEFFGDFHDSATGELQTNRMITIVDRSVEVRNEVMPTLLSEAPIYAVGWRDRPDNLWSMGPLDNLVGMQYRLDHLENLKADAMDLCVHPPLKRIGEVEEFVWGPGAEIVIDEGGDVQELGKNLNGIMAAASEMAGLEDRMELYAGAPREAAGIRTPGEKTLGEVMQLATAAGRTFQEKVTKFEERLLEPVINAMLESARRNLQGIDVVSLVNEEYGVQEFLEITAQDLVSNGIIKPVGARHFSKQAQDLQNLMTVFNSPLGQLVGPHTSAKNLTKFVSDISGLEGYEIFSPNAAVFEQQELQSTMNNVQEEAAAVDSTETVV